MPTKNKRPSSELIALAKTVFLAQAWEATVREPIEKIQSNLLKKGQYKNAHARRQDLPIILEHKHNYLMSDADFKAYYKLCYNEYVKLGFKNLEFETCPLLIAENLTRQAVRAMLEEAAKITGLTPNDILSNKNALANYDKATDLVLRYCAPYVNQKDILSELKVKKQVFTNVELTNIRKRVKETKKPEKSPSGNYVYTCCNKCEYVFSIRTMHLNQQRNCPYCGDQITVTL